MSDQISNQSNQAAVAVPMVGEGASLISDDEPPAEPRYQEDNFIQPENYYTQEESASSETLHEEFNKRTFLGSVQHGVENVIGSVLGIMNVIKQPFDRTPKRHYETEAGESLPSRDLVQQYDSRLDDPDYQTYLAELELEREREAELAQMFENASVNEHKDETSHHEHNPGMLSVIAEALKVMFGIEEHKPESSAQNDFGTASYVPT